jgi:formiminoglutamase
MDRLGWLTVRQGMAPLVVSLPHTGTVLPASLDGRLNSAWLARKDADWHVELLYDFAAALDATIVLTAISRTMIDVNRDPSGASLYPGQTTTGLCPLETFDGEPLYQSGAEPDQAEIELRKSLYFEPYHAALGGEIHRLRAQHRRVVLYDCHSIRSVVPRLFEGVLPHVNIGTNGGGSCALDVTDIVSERFGDERFSSVVNGRFKGGWITRHYGQPERGVHAVQVELACRAYLDERLGPVSESIWPVRYDAAVAAPLRERLETILTRLRDWAAG